MTKISLIAGLMLAAFTVPALADSVEDGANDFKKCKACHSIVDNDGNAIVKGGKTGPNLYGVIGRQIGTEPGFKYSESIIAAGADGTVWDEEMIAAYVADPTKWLKEKTQNDSAKSAMAFKLKDGSDVAAYLATMTPAQ
jgi:cytochrome c